ncbi:hypothetical protein [Pseudonocardia sp. GCM10023141]|uniref:hypothetical protein n=1 Tax=Pseudonocardia sp. GCM10023141 TaxID=3252653 RepID=UPI00361ADA25
MPRLSFGPVVEDPSTTVTGHGGATYLCPDLDTLDHHIAALYTKVTASRFGERVSGLWADIDRLLERRSWLTLTAVSTDPPRGADA